MLLFSPVLSCNYICSYKKYVYVCIVMYPIAAFTCLKKGSFCIIFAINLLYQVQNALNRIFDCKFETRSI